MDRILAFGCHPDDVEFMAAGTLALLADRGYEIHIATMTGGEVGSPDLTSQQIRAVRLKEAAASAALIGAAYHYAGGHDLEVEYSAEYRRMAVRILREVNPRIVFTLPPMDYLADHEQTSLLVRNASYIASVPLYDCGAALPPMAHFPYLYYWDASGGADIFGRELPLHFGVDVTGVMEKKEQMLACHESQREWLRFHNNWDQYIETMKQHSAVQGQRIGRPHGECFIQHLGTGHPQDNILKDILGELCVEI
ncbi:MAG: PIG-L family deacetylase [Planctomycetes bacterium]|nr:PIG-L family deacetylase [Planctomycetota bacterium]